MAEFKKYLFYFILFLLSAPFGCTKVEKKEMAKEILPEQVQNPVVAGTFYSADQSELASQIIGFIDQAEDFSPKSQVLGMMVPHAGHIYSGSIAGHAYNYLKKQSYKTIVIIAPSHYAPSRGVSILDKDYYRTPLGLIPVDTVLVNKLKDAADWITYDPNLYKKEHSLEVHLPFIQKSQPNAKIVPIIMGNNSIDLAKNLAKVLFDTLPEKEVFYIVSSDMSHFFPYDTANQIDAHTVKKIQSLDTTILFSETRARKTELCGLGPVITLMELFKKYGGRKVDLLKYANSGDTAGSKEKVVGYGTVAFTLGDYLSQQDKKQLIDIAKQTVDHYVRFQKIPEVSIDSPALLAEGAAFVTLKKDGHLRGCIGHLIARLPLYKTIQEMAVAAATNDHRFRPVTPEELEKITIEISVLTPMQLVKDPLSITVGEDGLLISKGGYQGVLLPQVPLEYGWSQEEFLQQTARKAGLPPDGWKEGAELYKFQAIVFGEEEGRTEL